MPKRSPKSASQANQLQEQVASLQAKLNQTQEQEKRALADYQNLVRRVQEERLQSIKMANRELLSALLQPLEHLELAAEQLADKGLKMALNQLRRTLAEFGLEEIEVQGKKFDLETMEAAEGSQEGGRVTQVLRQGYRLNGQVIQHAKIILE
jgi:molecular chaperone GrpE